MVPSPARGQGDRWERWGRKASPVTTATTRTSDAAPGLGYAIGAKGGRWLLERPGPFHVQRLQMLSAGQPFFERHGPKAVFFGRFVLGLRTWTSWLAGATHMRLRPFMLWNVIGGVVWASAVGTAGYLLGHSAGNALEAFGLYGLVVLLFALVVGGVLVARSNTPAQSQADALAANQLSPL